MDPEELKKFITANALSEDVATSQEIATQAQKVWENMDKNSMFTVFVSYLV